MVKEDNPCGRLHRILKKGLSIPNNKSNAKPQRIRDALEKILGVDSEDNIQVMYFFSQIVQLIEEARKSVEQLENVDNDLYLKPFGPIERAFSTANLEAPWANIKAQINENIMLGLEFCSDALSRQFGEDVIDDSTLSELQGEIEELLNEVLKSNLPSELKEVLIGNLEAIRKAILEYRIRGGESLRRAVESSIGSLLSHGATVMEQRDDPTVQKFFQRLDKLDKLVSFSLKVKQLAGPVISYLTVAIPNALGPGTDS